MLLLLGVTFCAASLWAQPPRLDTLWTRIYPQLDDSNECFYSIAATADNGLAITGYFYGGPSSNDGAVIKANPEGQLEWLRVCGGHGLDLFEDAVGTTDGGLLACGWWDDWPNGYQMLAVRYGASGDTQWVRRAASNPGCTGNVVIETEAGEYVIAGDVADPPGYGWPGLVKLTSDGEVVFLRNYGHPFWMRRTVVYDVVETWDHGFLLISEIFRQGLPLREYGYLIRTNAQGDSLWTRTLGYFDRSRNFVPRSICRADSGHYFMLAEVDDPSVPDYPTFLTLFKLTDQGDTLWSRRYEFPGLSHYWQGQMRRTHLVPDPQGGFLVSTTYAWEGQNLLVGVLFKIDLEGNVIWAGYYPEDRFGIEAYDVAVAADGSYLWLLFDWMRVRVLRLPANPVDAPPAPLQPISTFHLAQNYPNPFNGTTTIRFTLPRPMLASLKVYDVTGREVAVLLDERVNAGEHAVGFAGEGLASGVYLVRLQAGEWVRTRKVVLLR